MSNQKFQNFLDEVELLKEDAEKFFEKENKAAGTRLRKALQGIRNIAKEVRQEISDLKNKAKEDK